MPIPFSGFVTIQLGSFTSGELGHFWTVPVGLAQLLSSVLGSRPVVAMERPSRSDFLPSNHDRSGDGD